MNIKTGCELDTKPYSEVEERRGGGEARVSGDGDDSSSEEKGRVSAMEVDSRGRESVENDRVLDNEGSDDDVKDRVRPLEGSDLDKEVEGKKDKNSSFLVFDQQNDQYDPEDYTLNVKNDSIVSGGVKKEVYKALLSEFDDFVANEKNGAMAGTSRALSYGFEVGDMVWGKVKSHPWWPGHIFNEAFATSSVRRTRREGHVLVAFFGDSSYGWFDPAELIPFNPHFAEKSQQTNSRNFVKAVEEAADEASRRRGLGLACKCRNPYNFRPVTVQGYFAVDVPDFEPGGVYSANQIKKARDGFRPGETLSFVKQLALAPVGCDWSTIDFIKNKATVFAFRKAVFEEFDETYAQAFGVQPSRSPNAKSNLVDHPIKQPTRAPLSGPLVIAEALGGGKSSKKPPKVKDHSRKDRYLLKRREEPSELISIQIGQTQESSSTAAVYTEGSSAIAGGDYVLQKRAPSSPLSAKPEQTGFISTEGACPNEDVFGKEIVLERATDLGAPATEGPILDAKPTLDKEKVVLHEIKGKMGSDMVVGPTSTECPGLTGKGVPQDVIESTSPSFQPEGEESARASRPIEGSQQTELSFPARVGGENHSGLENRQDSIFSSHHSQVDGKHSVGVNTDGGVKKAKVLKRSLGDLGSENSLIREKKKKKKELGVETNSDRPKKLLVAGKGGAVMRNSSGKFSQVSLAPRDYPWVHQQKRDVGSINSSSNSVGTLPMVGFRNIDIELRQLLSDLHALALDPCHGAARNGPITMHFFLQFRSLVYQKSLVVSPPRDSEPVEVRSSKFPSSVGASDNATGENVRDLTPSKPVKALVRPDDPTKAGLKRMPSDRQEEIAAKRLKKIMQLKSLAAEKKAGQRTLESQRLEGKEPVAPSPSKQAKPDSVKKMEPSARLVEPTMLVMKFPPETSLPSVAQLKARFARFGSIDQSAIRVFWKSSTCRVVFRRKLDAQAAHRYAIGNNSLFGNVNVRYTLREVGGPAPEPEKGRGDDSYVETARAKDSLIERPTLSLSHVPLPQSTGQIKSILKKPTGDEAGQVTGGNGGRGTARVKFMLGGEETRRGEQLMVGNRNNVNNSASFADGGATTSVAMDFNSKNLQKVIPPSSMLIPPPPTQFAKTTLNNAYHSEVAPRNFPNANITGAALSPQSVDISQQMLNLLTRCNDVVNTVTGLLGYVPYHPL